MSFTELEDYTTPELGEGILAHFKRNPMKYLGLLTGVTYGATAYPEIERMNPATMPMIMGAVGLRFGRLGDALLNVARVNSLKNEANDYLDDLKSRIQLKKSK